MAKVGSHVLAIDQGTTGTTVAIVNSKGGIVFKSNVEHRQIYPNPGWVEHRPEDIWKSVTSQIEVCIKKARLKPAQITAIGITNQRETVVVWERRTGKALHNAIVWQDRRTSAFCEKLKQDGIEADIRNRTGLVVDPYFSASKLNWLLNNINGLKDRVSRDQIAAGTIDSFLLWRLTGGATFATDISNASRTQLMNLEKGEWDDDMLKLFDIPRNLLPEIGLSSGNLGVTKGLKFLPDGIPISGIAGDQQAALFGQACFEIGESKCTFGTGSFLLMNTGSRVVRSDKGLLSTAAWKLKGDAHATYALEGGAFICGAAVQFLRDQMGFIKNSSDVEKLARSVRDTQGVEFVPALTGLGAPYWNPEARGLICGLTRGTTQGHLARATLEAMALQNTEILQVMQANLQAQLKNVRVDGGAAANSLLMQIQADYLGVEVVRPGLIETTVAGAAYLAGLGVGVWDNLEEIKRIWRVNKRFLPNMTPAAREDRLKRWRKAVDRAQL